MCSLQERLMIDGGGLMVDALSPRGNTLNQGEWKTMGSIVQWKGCES